MTLKTEEEAAKCWCPFSQLVVPNPDFAAGNRFIDAPGLSAETMCIGSRCMAWIGGHPETTYSDTSKQLESPWIYAGEEVVIENDGKSNKVSVWKQDRGSCGLVRQP